MSKKVLIISTSMRKNGNSDLMARAFAKGAEEAGNAVEIVSLADKQIAFCRGCFACQKTGRCIINDDAIGITEKIAEAEVVVWATPIYYYEMTGQMKTMIDRANALFVKDYIDDEDGYEGKAFNRWYADMCKKGVVFDWEDYL